MFHVLVVCLFLTSVTNCLIFLRKHPTNKGLGWVRTHKLDVCSIILWAVGASSDEFDEYSDKNRRLPQKINYSDTYQIGFNQRHLTPSDIHVVDDDVIKAAGNGYHADVDIFTRRQVNIDAIPILRSIDGHQESFDLHEILIDMYNVGYGITFFFVRYRFGHVPSSSVTGTVPRQCQEVAIGYGSDFGDALRFFYFFIVSDKDPRTVHSVCVYLWQHSEQFFSFRFR